MPGRFVNMGTVLLYLLMALAVAYVGFGAFLFATQRRFLYRPMREVGYSPSNLDLEFEDVFFTTSDGLTLHGWFVPSAAARYTVLFCHGNAGNVMHRLDSIRILHDLGLHCFIFDYRGYGRSQGSPTEAGTYLDAQAAYDWLTGRHAAAAETVIIFGRSLGGSIAAHLASRVRAGGLVVESAFTSYPDMGARLYPYMPVRPFARFRYATGQYLRDVHCPVLLIHGRDDEMVPVDFARRLYDVANEPRTLVEVPGRHNDFFLVSGQTYKQAWRHWVESLGAP
ncbi:MAG TPA: alpha/beta hydrolase [Phycisphaerales bacterium]|nr:alpha/beta hydrolase [Phycisphaerales bacterium]